jgi:hypothetical protein
VAPVDTFSPGLLALPKKYPPQGDIVAGTGKAPCSTCPAPTTRFEAELYCSSQKKRLPTDLELELATRGVGGNKELWTNRSKLDESPAKRCDSDLSARCDQEDSAAPARVYRRSGDRRRPRVKNRASRNSPSLAVALNWGIGSSSLNAEVKESRSFAAGSPRTSALMQGVLLRGVCL